jgi:predicted transcriptional regulator/very-short-patch-repair endonuclease
MSFGEAHKQFVYHHQGLRSGERLRRLREGHGHAEKMFVENVWWPIMGHFQHLHPEYEVRDFEDHTRFVDFAYVRAPHRICFEIDGYGPHLKELDRWRFGDNLMRQNQLMLDDWKVFRFSYDDIIQKQRRCQQFLLHIIGRWYGGDHTTSMKLSYRERDILTFAAMLNKPLKTADVAEHLGISPHHSRKWLKMLHEKGLIKPVRSGDRIHAYILDSQESVKYIV